MTRNPAAILIDTHIIIWAAMEPKRLSKRALGAMDNAQRIHFSTWLDKVIARFGLIPLPMSVDAALKAEELADYPNRDPADRIIVGTALVNDIPIVTVDQVMRDWKGVTTIW